MTIEWEREPTGLRCGPWLHRLRVDDFFVTTLHPLSGVLETKQGCSLWFCVVNANIFVLPFHLFLKATV